MKKVNVFLAGAFVLLLSIGANAQTKTGMDFFIGNWNLSAEGGPLGTSELKISLERKEEKLVGTVTIGKEDAINFSKIDETESSLKLYFTSSNGNNISIALEKIDADHVSGSLDTSVVGVLDVKGERIKENK
jgi:hypothetical protein